MKIALAQISPIWLNKKLTLKKIEQYVAEAASKNCHLVAFGEALLPGYSFWLSHTNGSNFDNKIQKEIHSHYAQNAVVIENGDLENLCKLSAEKKIAVYLGCIERPTERGGHSLYCSLVYINEKGEIKSVHRKLQPTFEERLTWAPGDGNGLVTHPLNGFTLGGLNCWENWMPLPRASLYAQGENVHIAVWPGSIRNTEDISRFIAKESRSYVVSVSGLFRKKDIPKDTPHYDQIVASMPNELADGGSCVAAPDGSWVLPPVCHEETILTATIHLAKVLEERQNFDPSGHYSRPDVTQLTVDRTRQSTVRFKEATS